MWLFRDHNNFFALKRQFSEDGTVVSALSCSPTDIICFLAMATIELRYGPVILVSIVSDFFPHTYRAHVAHMVKDAAVTAEQQGARREPAGKGMHTAR
jgi:hypothetical protein